jgi:hypothetical protein
MNKRFQCRTHEGGIFSMPARRGRPSVRCTEEHPCDKAEDYERATEPRKNRERQLAKSVTRPVERNAEPRTMTNPSLPLAKEAKARLEAVGWVCKGRAFADDDGSWCAELTASRDQETLIMQWVDGNVVRQDYAMEFLKVEENKYPDRSLTFDPDEVTDSELIRMVRGMKVTWWNTIAGAKETAIVGGTVTIEHIFRDNGDEDNSKRIVKFLDHGGGGFRAFHSSALLKVG